MKFLDDDDDDDVCFVQSSVSGDFFMFVTVFERK